MFFTSKTRQTFTKLRQIFVKILIYNHFDPKRHMQIETDASGYTISSILSELVLNDSG